MHLGVGRIRIVDRLALVLARRHRIVVARIRVLRRARLAGARHLVLLRAGDLRALVAGGVGVGAISKFGTLEMIVPRRAPPIDERARVGRVACPGPVRARSRRLSRR